MNRLFHSFQCIFFVSSLSNANLKSGSDIFWHLLLLLSVSTGLTTSWDGNLINSIKLLCLNETSEERPCLRKSCVRTSHKYCAPIFSWGYPVITILTNC